MNTVPAVPVPIIWNSSTSFTWFSDRETQEKFKIQRIKSFKNYTFR